MADISTIDRKLHFECTHTIAPSYVDVGNTSTLIVAGHSSNKYILIVNDSDEVIYLQLQGAALMNRGIRLNAHGGAFEISPGTLRWRGDIYGIHGGSGTKRVTLTIGAGIGI